MKIQKGLFFDDLDTYIIKNIVSCYKNNLVIEYLGDGKRLCRIFL